MFTYGLSTKNLDSTVLSALLLVIICGLNLRCTKFIYYLLHRIQTQKSHSCLTLCFFFFFFFFFWPTLILPFTTLSFLVGISSLIHKKICFLVVLERERERQQTTLILNTSNFCRTKNSCGLLVVVRERLFELYLEFEFLGIFSVEEVYDKFICNY